MKLIGTKLVMRSLKETRFHEISDIVKCEGSGNYSRLFLDREGYSEFYSVQIGQVYQLLKEMGFIRVRKNLLVNFTFIKEIIHGKQRTIVLENGDQIKVSYRRSSRICVEWHSL